MIITKRIILSDEEQELLAQVQDLLTSVGNEVERKEQIEIEKLNSDLEEFCYHYGSDDYRASYEY